MPMPNVFIVGAAKAGTTSLHTHLSAHPEVFMSRLKEPNHFVTFTPSARYRRTISRVTSAKEYRELFRDAGNRPVIGESSTAYLWDRESAALIKQAVPQAKIIILLRHPVERAHSHYLMDVKDGYQRMSFYEALVEDYSIPDKSWGGPHGHLYVELGLYASQVEQYFRFFDRDKVAIHFYDDLVHRPRWLMQEIARFLEIDPGLFDQIDLSTVHNPYTRPRSPLAQLILRQEWLRRMSQSIVPSRLRKYVRKELLTDLARKPGIDESAVQFLDAIYEPDIARLQQLLGTGFLLRWAKDRKNVQTVTSAQASGA